MVWPAKIATPLMGNSFFLGSEVTLDNFKNQCSYPYHITLGEYGMKYGTSTFRWCYRTYHIAYRRARTSISGSPYQNLTKTTTNCTLFWVTTSVYTKQPQFGSVITSTPLWTTILLHLKILFSSFLNISEATRVARTACESIETALPVWMKLHIFKIYSKPNSMLHTFIPPILCNTVCTF